MPRPLRAIVAVSIALVALAGSALAATPVKVHDQAGVKEWSGSAIDGWSAWSANGKARPRVYKTYVKPDGGSATTIPVKGTTALGDLIATGPRKGQVAFQATFASPDIRFYDPGTDAVLRAPKGINTAKIEEQPEADGDYLAFDRVSPSSWDTYLYRFSTHKAILLGHRLTPGQVNGDYVAMSGCTKRTCQVFRYRISTKNVTKVPRAASGRANYWAAVMGDGTVYYVQGSYSHCGRNTKIVKFRAGNVATVLKVPDGTELASMEARTVNGSDQLLFTEITCGAGGAVKDTGVYSVAI